MTAGQAFSLLMGVYYLALGVWAGALAMLAVAAAATFRTVRATLPDFGAVTQNQIAGSIVGNAIAGLSVIEIGCALVAGIALILQCTAYADRFSRGVSNKVRIALIVLAIVVLGADRLVIAPRIYEYRQAMHAQAATDEQRDEARAVFDRYHRLSERAAGGMLLLLAAATVMSPFTLNGKLHDERSGGTEA